MTAPRPETSTPIFKDNRRPSSSHYDDEGQEDIVIAVMGTTGAGKSKFIKVLTNNPEIQEGHNLESCTQRIEIYHTTYSGRRIVFVDTPGFDDTHRKDTDILKEIAKWLELVYSVGQKLTGIIYLHRITDNRLVGSALRNLRMFQALCGNEVMSNVLLTTTHWDCVDNDRALAREQQLRNTFWRGMVERGSQLKRFDGTQDKGWQAIDSLLGRDPIVLAIQREIVDEKKTVANTSAGQMVNEELTKLQREYEAALMKLEVEVKDALAEKDDELANILAEEKKMSEEKLASLRREQEELMRHQTEEMNKRLEILMAELREAENRGGLFGRIGRALDKVIRF